MAAATPNDNSQPSTDSQVEKDDFGFTWTFNFSKIMDHDEVHSKIFQGGPKTNHSWRLKMFPKQIIDGVRYLGLHLQLTDFGTGPGSENNGRKVKVRFEMNILGTNGGRVKGTDCVREFAQGTSWGYTKFIRISALESNGLLKDKLTIFMQIWTEEEIKQQTGICQQTDNFRIVKKVKLVQDLVSVFKNLGPTDITIIANGRSIPAHRTVLAVGSPVFNAMLRDDLGPNFNVEISELHQFGANVVKGMVDFIYTGKVDEVLMGQSAPNLLQISEVFGVKGLKMVCEIHMAQHLSTGNVSDLLAIAHYYRAPLLMSEAMDFFNRNKENVKNTESFKRATENYPEIFVELDISFGKF